MEDHNQETPTTGPQEPTKRSSFLTTICILSYIGSGLSIIGGLFYMAFYDLILNLFASNESELYQAMYESISTLSRGYFGAETLFAATSLTGVLLMWNLKKIGFHIYTISNILALSLPLLFGVGSFNFANLLLVTGPFVAMYASQLKNMR